MENKEELKKDLDKYQDFVILKNSKGGQRLIEALKEDVITSFGSLSNYKEMSRDELVSIICQITERINILTIFKNAKKQADVLKEILDEEK